MKALAITTQKDLLLVERPNPTALDNECVIKVRAAGINRADILMRKGLYPGELVSDVIGLEMAGEVVSCGRLVKRFKPGDRVCGIVTEGAYAEYCVVDADTLLPIPESLSYIQGAAIAESFLTAQEALVFLAQAKTGDRVLIHAGGSGVGTACIQLAHLIGAEVFFTAGSDEKIDKGLTLQANYGINYRTKDFSSEIDKITQGKGVNIILDFVGANYFPRNMQLLADDGMLIIIGFLSGIKCELNLALLLKKRLQIKGLMMRSLSLEKKRQMAAYFEKHFLAEFDKGHLQAVIDSVFPFADARKAHHYMESNKNFGKIVLSME